MYTAVSRGGGLSGRTHGDLARPALAPAGGAGPLLVVRGPKVEHQVCDEEKIHEEVDPEGRVPGIDHDVVAGPEWDDKGDVAEQEDLCQVPGMPEIRVRIDDPPDGPVYALSAHCIPHHRHSQQKAVCSRSPAQRLVHVDRQRVHRVHVVLTPELGLDLDQHVDLVPQPQPQPVPVGLRRRGVQWSVSADTKFGLVPIAPALWQPERRPPEGGHRANRHTEH